jgi:signal peptidase I
VIDERERERDANELSKPVNDHPVAAAPQAETPALYESPSPAMVAVDEVGPPGAAFHQTEPQSLGLLPLSAPPPEPGPMEPVAMGPLAMEPAANQTQAAAAPADAARSFPEAIVPPDVRLTSPGVRIAQIKEELVAWVKTLVSAAVYAVLIVTFGFQVARVEGQSMAPTLEDQDRLIVNKLVYRIGEPRRGDIVMLYYPLNPDKSFVKRVIAEEGDTVRIVDGRVYVNDIPLKDDYVSSEFRSHDDWGPQVIPEGYYFVMGDHRNNSSDSRHWGMVPKRYIIGKVQLRWWPVPTARVF